MHTLIPTHHPGYFSINGCMLFLHRGYQDHMETLGHRGLRESRSAPFEQLLLTTSCTAAVTFTFPFMITLNKRLELYHPGLCLSAQRPVCIVIDPCVNKSSPSLLFTSIGMNHQWKISLQVLLMACILFLNTDSEVPTALSASPTRPAIKNIHGKSVYAQYLSVWGHVQSICKDKQDSWWSQCSIILHNNISP